MHTRLLLVLVAAALAVSCSRSREIERDLQIREVETGWYDAGIVDGANKLVPSLSLRIENVSERDIARVQLYAVFRRVSEPDVVWGEHLLQGIDRDGLDAGATGAPIVIRSPLGYTGSDPRQTLLESPHFVDVRVELMGRHGPRTWVKLGEYPIERRLLTE